MRRTTLALACVTLAVVTLAGCGGDDNAAYCDAVESAGKTLSGLDGADGFDDAVASLKEVRDEASGEAKENWDTLISSFEAMKEGKVDDVDTDAVEKAGKAIEKQVKDDCDIELSELG